MAVIPAGFCQANLFFGGPPLPLGAQVVLGFDVGGVITNPTEAATIIGSAFADADILNLMSSGTIFQKVLVKFGPTATGPSAEAQGGAASVGDTGGAAAPSVLMHKHTASGGRQGRGRSYWPALPESQVTPGGTLGAGVATAWLNALEIFFADLDGQGLAHVVLHGDALAPSPVTSISIAGVVASQRRRQRR